MVTRPDEVDLRTVEAILTEARKQESEALSDEVPTDAAIARLGKVEVQELDGSTIPIGSLWKTRPAAIVFLRHYG